MVPCQTYKMLSEKMLLQEPILPALLKNIINKMPNDLKIPEEISKTINENNLNADISEGGVLNKNYHPKLLSLTDRINLLTKHQDPRLSESDKRDSLHMIHLLHSDNSYNLEACVSFLRA